jgi:hypothetical protein
VFVCAVAIELISEHIRSHLLDRGFVFDDLMSIPGFIGDQLPPNVVVMKSTNQTKEMHTIIRDQRTSRSDFIFHSERLSRLLIEEALCHLPCWQTKTVTTPTGTPYHGIHFNTKVHAHFDTGY